jgi:hypothetical protein
MKSIIIAIVFFCFYSSAAQLDGILGINFADEVDTQGSGESNSDPAFVLGARYSDKIQNNFGFQSGVLLETIRDVGASAELGFMSLYGNITYDLQKIVYVFAGFNFPIFIYEDKNLGDVDSVLGVQFGSGYRFTKDFGFEILYKTTNFEFAGRDAELWGFSILGSYRFASF